MWDGKYHNRRKQRQLCPLKHFDYIIYVVYLHALLDVIILVLIIYDNQVTSTIAAPVLGSIVPPSVAAEVVAIAVVLVPPSWAYT